MRNRIYCKLINYFALMAMLLTVAQQQALAQNIYYTSFESFTSSNHQGWNISDGVWQTVAPTNTSGPGSAYDGKICAWTGGGPGGNYIAGQDSRLSSPAIQLPAIGVGQQIVLSFWQWSKWNAGDGAGYVQVSTWNNNTWTAWTNISSEFSGSSGLWNLASVDLSAYHGQQVRIGFWHATNAGTAPGWYIDDFSIDESGENDLMAVGVQSLPYSTGFENSTGSDTTGAWQGWSADNGVWQIGSPPNNSGPGTAYDGSICAYTTGPGGGYVSGQSSRLISPALQLPEISSSQQIVLTFWQWFKWNPGDGSGYVQVSTWTNDAWTPWTNLSSECTGSSGLWDLTSIDLSAYHNQQIRIGFWHATNAGTDPGWYIDDVDIDVVANQMVPNQTIGFENFVSSPPLQNWFGWSADNGVWTVGVPNNPLGPGKAHDGIQCAYTSGGAGGGYVPGQGSHLISPALYLPAVPGGDHIYVKFWQWYQWNSGDGSGFVQISTWSKNNNAWTAWTNISEEYLGSSGGWIPGASADLSAYQGQQIRIGFWHDSGEGTAPGWYIDDVTIVLPAPTIASFSPTKGEAQTAVAITGTFFQGATAVAFNGTPAVFTVVSPTEITTTVPVGATTGPITVTTPGGTGTSSTNFTVLVARANSQNIVVARNTETNITLTGSSPDSLPLTYAIVSSPTHGTLGALNTSTGSITYTPNINFGGTDSFTFTVNDGIETSAPGRINLKVTPGTPTANAQTVSVDLGTATAIKLTGTDPDSPPLTLKFAITAAPSNGTLGTLNATTGAVTYTPNASYQGTDSFTFTVSNGTFVSSPATVTLNVAPGTPTAKAQTVSVAHGTATAITLAGIDPDNPPLALTYAVAAQPANGTVTGLNSATGAATYTPNANFHGTDTFTFTVSNGTKTSPAATVTLKVTAGTPTANPQTVAIAHDSANTITLTGTDADSPALPLTFAIVGKPAHGTLGTLNAATGVVKYTPVAAYSGADSFSFTVSNGTNKSAAATVTLNVAAGTPKANAQTVNVAHGTATAITLTGTDPDVPALSLAYSIVAAPTNGTLGTLNKTTGAVTYTPKTNFQGTDTFTFTVSNGTNTSAPATVSLKVSPGTPTANAQTVAVVLNTPTKITLTGSDPDVPALPLTFAIATKPTHGVLGSLNASTGVLVYTPDKNFAGADSFTFTVSNGTNKSAAATVTLNVGGG